MTERADLDGHTLDELSDYLDAGRFPPDPTIDSSPACQIALDDLERIAAVSLTMLERGAAADPTVDEGWVSRILGAIRFDAHAGRLIPLGEPSPDARVSITEGAVRGLIRAAGDQVGGLIVGRSRLVGEVTIPGEPVIVTVEVTVCWGEKIDDIARMLRRAIAAALESHTDLHVAAIDITVRDLFGIPEPPAQMGSES